MSHPIEDYALLGDLHTAALVARDGSIDWLCLPRFDSAACFAALLGGEDDGRWQIAPASGGDCVSRRYRGHSLVLESQWDTPEGSVRVIDLMPPRDDVPDIVRIVEGISGRVSMKMDLRLRFDYGNIVPWVRHRDGMLEAIAGPDAVWLRTLVHLRGKHMTTVAEFEVAAGDRVPFVLTYSPSHQPTPRVVDPERALADTESFWSKWISRAQVDGPWADEVRDSLVVLKAMTYAPTGGLVAAATTSLPEQIGGPRNWDYRYCWLRDATFSLRAMIDTGFIDEAKAWREWLLRAVAGDPADLQIMYAIDGTRRLTEYEVPWLSGYEGSSPVRIGNAASEQLQLDVWGEVLDSLHLSREAGLQADEHGASRANHAKIGSNISTHRQMSPSTPASGRSRAVTSGVAKSTPAPARLPCSLAASIIRADRSLTSTSHCPGAGASRSTILSVSGRVTSECLPISAGIPYSSQVVPHTCADEFHWRRFAAHLILHS